MRGRLDDTVGVKVFLSHSVEDADGPIPSRVRAVAAAYGVALLLPERQPRPRSGAVSRTNRSLLKDADAVIAVIASNDSLGAVEAEVEVARELAKPLIVLTDRNLPTLGFGGANIVRFDRDAPAAHEKALADALVSLRAAKTQKADAAREAIVIGALAGIVVGLVMLAAANATAGSRA
jgi:hypothetical protein